MATSTIKNIPTIVEAGIDGIWRYRKWSDGVAECWGCQTKTMSGVSQTAPFSGYEYDFGMIAFPTGLFITVPIANVSGKVGSSYNVVSYANVYQAGVSVALQSNASSSYTCNAYIQAKGRWK